MNDKRLTIEQLEVGECYFSEANRQRYKIIGTDKQMDNVTKTMKKVLVAKIERSDKTRSKNNTYLSRNDIDGNFFHLSLNNPIQ